MEEEDMTHPSPESPPTSDRRPLDESDHKTCLITEEKMRRKLQFFFMNPIEKWHAKRRIPYKFIVQLIKIILVTLQLCLFANSRYNHVNYTWDNRITFSHLFLRGWDATREVNAYPPAAGPLAVYTIDEFFDTIDYAFAGYANLSRAVGPYSYSNEDNTMPPMVLCVQRYKKGTIFGFNESYVFDSELIEKCFNLTAPVKYDNHDTFSSKRQLTELVLNFSAFVSATLKFALKTVNFKSAGRLSAPNCYRFDVTINFDNADHDGQVSLRLDAEPLRLQCNGDTQFVIDTQLQTILSSLLNYLVIIICLSSFVLCARAVWRAQQLKNITVRYFALKFHRKLDACDRDKFLNLWYLMIISNDALIIIGSAIKEQIEREEFTSDQWNVCSLFLGTGNMLVWFGLLRYLGFFKTYNVVMLTVAKAAPKVARFLLCALLIYAGFTFCGWLVFGPYHIKFRTISTTSECLFALINGDDMFATFSIMSTKSTILWWFSKVYLYAFISLYIYVILSLFISVIMDAYETIKMYYIQGFPKSDLQRFIGETSVEEMSSGVWRSESSESLNGLIRDLCGCCPFYAKFRKSYSSLSTPHNDECLLKREEHNSRSSNNIPV